MQKIDAFYVGQNVIVRTYSAGCWAGKLILKEGDQVIIENARRLWYWKAKKGISLSAIAEYGIDHEESRIPAPVKNVNLVAIEIIAANDEAFNSIMNAPEAQQK